MASTISAATMTVTLTEEITLNGSQQGATNTIDIASVNEVSKRIVTATTTEQVILAFGAVVAAGQFLESKVVYIRITNLDNANHVGLIFRNEDSDELSVKLDKGQSFIYNGDLEDGVVDTMDAAATAVTPNAFADLVDVTATAHTTACDLEIFVACI